MDASQYKDYVLFMLFIQYISFKDMIALKGTMSIPTPGRPRCGRRSSSTARYVLSSKSTRVRNSTSSPTRPTCATRRRFERHEIHPDRIQHFVGNSDPNAAP